MILLDVELRSLTGACGCGWGVGVVLLVGVLSRSLPRSDALIVPVDTPDARLLERRGVEGEAFELEFELEFEVEVEFGLLFAGLSAGSAASSSVASSSAWPACEEEAAAAGFDTAGCIALAEIR